MSFTELTFVFVLLPLTVLSALALKWLKSGRIKNIVILILSIGFFTYYSPESLLVLILFILFVYLLGQLVHTARSDAGNKKKWMIIAVSSLVFVLAYSKYFPEILSWWNGFKIWKITYTELISIAGISFITFSGISYIVDIYKGNATPGSLPDAALYL